MKLKELKEQVMSGAIAPVVIPGGVFGKIIRRPFFTGKGDFIINFKKKKKKKKKLKEEILAGTGIPEKSEIYKASVRKFKKNSLIKHKKKKKKSKVKKVEPFV